MITLHNPDEAAFEEAYASLTGYRAAHPGRSAKVLDLVRNRYSGQTLFGICVVGWEGEYGDKTVVISLEDDVRLGGRGNQHE